MLHLFWVKFAKNMPVGWKGKDAANHFDISK